MRLVVALEATCPQTVEGFFGLVFLKVRQVLLDMAKGQRRVRCTPPGQGRSTRPSPRRWRPSTGPTPRMIRDGWRC